MAAILALALIQENERIPRIIRPARVNCFENMSESDFVKNFRLNKTLTKQLIKELKPFLEPRTTRQDVISAETKVRSFFPVLKMLRC